MIFIAIIVIIALVLPTAHAIWHAYDADDIDEWEDEDNEQE